MAKTNIMFSKLPKSSLEEVVLMDDMKLFSDEKNKLKTIEKLKEGYVEMGKINLVFAEFGLNQDVIDLSIYEARLTGCDIL